MAAYSYAENIDKQHLSLDIVGLQLQVSLLQVRSRNSLCAHQGRIAASVVQPHFAAGKLTNV